MTISAMKQALEALDAYSWEQVDAARTALRQAIAEAEKQKPVAIGEEWKPCVKLPIVVHVREQRKGEAHVSTREGITPVKEDDLIMRGVAGEEYPISRELFNRTYTFDTAPVHASDISQERVDETAKREHEVEFREYLTRLNWQQGFERGWDDAVEKLTLTQEKLGYTAPPKREWVGLTDEERKLIIHEWRHQEGKAAQLCQAIEAKLKQKNT